MTSKNAIKNVTFFYASADAATNNVCSNQKRIIPNLPLQKKNLYSNEKWLIPSLPISLKIICTLIQCGRHPMVRQDKNKHSILDIQLHNSVNHHTPNDKPQQSIRGATWNVASQPASWTTDQSLLLVSRVKAFVGRPTNSGSSPSTAAHQDGSVTSVSSHRTREVFWHHLTCDQHNWLCPACIPSTTPILTQHNPP